METHLPLKFKLRAGACPRLGQCVTESRSTWEVTARPAVTVTRDSSDSELGPSWPLDRGRLPAATQGWRTAAALSVAPVTAVAPARDPARPASLTAQHMRARMQPPALGRPGSRHASVRQPPPPPPPPLQGRKRPSPPLGGPVRAVIGRIGIAVIGRANTVAVWGRSGRTPRADPDSGPADPD